MKIRICLVLGFLFSILNCKVNPLLWSQDKFLEVENKVQAETRFVENGVKVEFCINSSQEDTVNLLTDNFIKVYDKENLEINENRITANMLNEKIIADIYESNNKTYVEISLTNSKKEKSISNLMKELSVLQINTSEKPRYFKYIKGKIDNVEDGLTLIKNINILDDVNTLDIHNGYVGRATINDERINFAVSTYESDTYLIIGTPIIFSTY